MKTKKLIKAIKFIRRYCKHTDCNKCVFFTGGCGFDSPVPSSWDIKYIKENLKDIEEL